MNTIIQSRSPSPSLSRQSDELSAEPDIARSPLQALMDDANAGGDQHNGAGTPAANALRDPANFASAGPMTNLLSEPLLSNPFALAQIAGGRPVSVNAAQQTQPTSYTVKSGDTLNGIAAVHDISLDELIALNPQIRNPDMIHPGDRITVSSRQNGDGNRQPSTHTVVSGDTLNGIAAQHGVSLNALLAANPQIRNPDMIHPGDVINLPSGTEKPEQPGGPAAPGETPDVQGDSGNVGSTTGAVDLALSNDIHERSTPGRQSITSPVIGDFTITEGFMARGGPHSSKSARQAIFSDNPTVAENVPAGVYNLGIDYFTADGRIDSWFNGEVIGTDYSPTGYGNRLIMKSDVMFEYNGQSYPVFAHYAHADSFNVSAGDRITAGQDIGDQGSTGASTGDHVDFHTWIEVNGQRITISPNLLTGG